MFRTRPSFASLLASAVGALLVVGCGSPASAEGDSSLASAPAGAQENRPASARDERAASSEAAAESVGEQTSALRPLVLGWDPSRAILAGSGCEKDVDTYVYSTTGGVGVAFYGMALDLSSGVEATAGRVACSLRVPMRLPHGYYVSAIRQPLLHSVVTSNGGSASVSLLVSVLGMATASGGVRFDAGETRAQPYAVVRADEDFRTDDALRDAFCDESRGEDGFLRLSVVLGGQKAAREETVRVRTTDILLREGLEVSIAKCP